MDPRIQVMREIFQGIVEGYDSLPPDSALNVDACKKKISSICDGSEEMNRILIGLYEAHKDKVDDVKPQTENQHLIMACDRFAKSNQW